MKISQDIVLDIILKGVNEKLLCGEKNKILVANFLK